MQNKMEIKNILTALNITAEMTKVFKEKDHFTEYLLDNKYILKISESELPEQKKNYRVNSLPFVSEIHSSGPFTVSGHEYHHLLFDYIQGIDLFIDIQNLADEQKYNIGKEIAQFLCELHSIIDASYDKYCIIYYFFYRLINGREYLSKLMDKNGIKYEMYNNSFSYIEDFGAAQKLADDILNKKLSDSFDGIARKINNLLPNIENIFHHSYYWCVDQCETELARKIPNS